MCCKASRFVWIPLIAQFILRSFIACSMTFRFSLFRDLHIRCSAGRCCRSLPCADKGDRPAELHIARTLTASCVPTRVWEPPRFISASTVCCGSHGDVRLSVALFADRPYARRDVVHEAQVGDVAGLCYIADKGDRSAGLHAVIYFGLHFAGTLAGMSRA